MASIAAASSSTRRTQRVRRRPGAGEIAIVRELLVLRLRGRFRRSRAGRGRLVRAGFPACRRVSLAALDPGWVGVDPVPQFGGDQVDPDPAGPVVQVPENALAVA